MTGGRAVLLALAVLPVVVVAACGSAAEHRHLSSAASTAVVDVVEAVVAAVAAVACAVRAGALLRARSRARAGALRTPGAGAAPPASTAASWVVFSFACGSWAAGQAVWSVDEVLLGREAPVLSLADVGFLGFAAAAPVAMALLGRAASRPLSRARTVLDGFIVAGSLFVISWIAVLASVVRSGARSDLLLAVSLAYPLGDVVVVAVATMVVARTRLSAPVLALTAGATLMALSDSAYVYLSSTATFSTGGPTDAGWTAAFVLITAAACARPRAPRAPRAESCAGLAVWTLPYWPLAVAGGMASAQVWHRTEDRTGILALTAVSALVLVRQGLVVVDNVRLARQLRAMAYTDPLTGIGNRAAFTEVLERLIDDGEPLTAAFCDLDAFKTVNDRCGHAVGDAVLTAVARRLTEVARAEDVVARLGGDEFAVVITGDHSAGQAEQIRQRLVTALSVPFSLSLERAGVITPEMCSVVDRVTASIGVVRAGDVEPLTADALLHVADLRMYEMKRGHGEGGGRRSVSRAGG